MGRLAGLASTELASGRPRQSTSPRLGAYSPAMQRPSVLLPQPDSPTMPRVSPGCRRKETSRTACRRSVGCAEMTSRAARLREGFARDRLSRAGGAYGGHARPLPESPDAGRLLDFRLGRPSAARRREWPAAARMETTARRRRREIGRLPPIGTSLSGAPLWRASASSRARV